MIPNPDTFCEIDPQVVDKWGIPVLRFHFAWGDRMKSRWLRICRRPLRRHYRSRSGGTVFGAGMRDPQAPQNDLAMGEGPTGSQKVERSFTNLGTVRMGNDPKTSASE